MSVVIRKALNSHEEQFINERLKKVHEALAKHKIHCDKDNVPRVALLGSGGGQRAQTGFLGVIQQLGKENLLDCMLYVAGVSGSTWCMSSLYQDSEWSQHPEKATNDVLSSMYVPKGPSLSQGVQWLKDRSEEGDVSLSDVWGVLTCRFKGVPLEATPLICEKDDGGVNPYPLYSAIEKHFHEKKIEDLWFEFSPDEVGFLEPGAYIKTELLKKDFEEGKLKPEQPVKRETVDMVEVQGMCGCAMGSLKTIKEFILETLKDWIGSIFQDKSEVVFILADMMETHEDHSVSNLQKLKTLLGENLGEFSTLLKDTDDESWRKMTTQNREKLVEAIAEELNTSAEKWTQTQLEISVSDVIWLVRLVFSLIKGWHFGTVSNFLYKFEHHRIPKDMTLKEKMHLIDAGLYLNSPYPSALRLARFIDLIISFDFSDKDPFKTLRVASEYAEKYHHPFPIVDFTHLDPERPKSFYVFEGNGKPTVIHIPLFNMDNCKSEAKIKDESWEYTTFQKPYRNKEKVDHLAELAAENVKMNKENILQKIQEAIQWRTS